MPRRRLELADGVEAEARDAFLWYLDRNPQAADRFEAELAGVLLRIEEEPAHGNEVDPGVRRLLLPHFPYGVLYAVEPDRVLVLAIMHLRRRPGCWRTRR